MMSFIKIDQLLCWNRQVSRRFLLWIATTIQLLLIFQKIVSLYLANCILAMLSYFEKPGNRLTLPIFVLLILWNQRYLFCHNTMITIQFYFAIRIMNLYQRKLSK